MADTQRYAPDFNYALWTADTEITLANVPWNSDYRDIVRFDSDNGLDNYINGNTNEIVNITNSTYAALNAPVRLNVPFNTAMQFNYLRAHNPGMPISGDVPRTYYYFITDVQYVAPNTTQVSVQLDVWQTFGRGIALGRSYVERGHVGIANTNSFARRGSAYLTVPEGMELGGEYETADMVKRKVMRPGGAPGGAKYNVIVASTVQLHADAGTVDNPKIEVAGSGQLGGIPTGVTYYIFNETSSAAPYANLMSYLKTRPWVAQGIVSVTVVPELENYFEEVRWGNVSFGGTTLNGVIVIGAVVSGNGYLGAFSRAKMHPFTMSVGWRDSGPVINAIPERYRHLKKFLTYPYLAIELTTWNGTPVMIKPEQWADQDAALGSRLSLSPPGQRMTFWPRWYGYNYDSSGASESGTTGDDRGEFLNMAVHIDKFPTLPTVNDSATLALANNAQGIAHSYAAAEWSQQRALRGADVAYRQSSSAIDAANRQTDLTNQHNRQVTDYNNQHNMNATGLNAMNNIAQGALQGGVAGPAGMVSGALGGAAGLPFAFASAAMEAQRASQITGMTASHASQSGAISAGHSAFVRDTNRGLAAFAANGDYANAIAGIDARVQDLQMTPPSVLGQHGGETANLYGDTMEVALRWKLVNRGVIQRVGEYWLRFGYAINHFVTPPDDLHCMSHFTYWKMAATYVHGARMPETFKQAIRGIFEKGVTVWRNPDDIGVLDAGENKALPGVTYNGRS